VRVRCDRRAAGWRAEGERRRSLVEVRAMGGKAEALAAESGRAEERMRRRRRSGMGRLRHSLR